MEEKVENNENRSRKSARSIIDDDRRAPYPEKCPECGSTKIVNNPERAEIFCGNCGIVIEENMIDLGPEWRAYDESQETKRARTGMPETYRIHDKGLSTALLPKKMLSKSKSQWLLSSQERTHIFAIREIERMSSALELPRYIVDRAAYLYREAMKENLIRGQSVEKIVSAILWIVCRENEIPRTCKEIAAVSRISGNKKAQNIFRNAGRISKRLKLEIKSASPIKFVSQPCSKLGLSGEIQSKAIKIVEEASKKESINCPNPKTIASVAISIAIDLFGEHRTEEKITEACGVTATTLRNHRKKIEKELNIKILANQLSSQELINEISSRLDYYSGITEQKRIKNRAVKIMEKTEKYKRENEKKEKNRKALAAAALAIAVKEECGKNILIARIISEATGIKLSMIVYRKKIINEIIFQTKKIKKQ